MSKKSHIAIIGTGLGRDDLSAQSLRTVDCAQILIGGRRQLAMFPGHAAEKIIIGKDAALLVEKLKAKLSGKRAVVLASGDPNFYGIAALFYSNFPKAQIEIIPGITAFQAAFARIKMPWENASFISIHGKSMRALDAVVRRQGKFVIYCDGSNTPAAAASYLIEKDCRLAQCRSWVFDSLGLDGEKISAGTLGKMVKEDASALSMMIILNELEQPVYSPGIPDSLFAHDRAMITRRDVRLMVLARLELAGGMVLWDIGAGSGSVAVEAAVNCPGIQAYAVEKNPRRFKQLQANIRRFRAPNIKALEGQAPEVLAGLPAPDRVFIGGSGGELEAILNSMKKRLAGGAVLVVNCVTMDTLETVLGCLRKWRWRYEVTSVQNSRLVSGRQPEIFRAENPVFIVQGRAAAGR